MHIQAKSGIFLLLLFLTNANAMNPNQMRNAATYNTQGNGGQNIPTIELSDGHDILGVNDWLSSDWSSEEEQMAPSGQGESGLKHGEGSNGLSPLTQHGGLEPSQKINQYELGHQVMNHPALAQQLKSLPMPTHAGGSGSANELEWEKSEQYKQLVMRKMSSGRQEPKKRKENGLPTEERKIYFRDRKKIHTLLQQEFHNGLKPTEAARNINDAEYNGLEVLNADVASKWFHKFRKEDFSYASMGPRKQKFPVQIVQANSQSIADGEASSAVETVIYDPHQHKLVNGVPMSADNASTRQPKKPRRAQQKTAITVGEDSAGRTFYYDHHQHKLVNGAPKIAEAAVATVSAYNDASDRLTIKLRLAHPITEPSLHEMPISLVKEELAKTLKVQEQLESDIEDEESLLELWRKYGTDPEKLRKAEENHAGMMSHLEMLKQQVANLEKQKNAIENCHINELPKLTQEEQNDQLG